MGITYDQDYIDLPRGAATEAQDAANKAHHSYFAQTAGRNLNHCLAEKTCPVLLTYHEPGGTGWVGGTPAEMGPRGRCIIWRPHYSSIVAVAKMQYHTGPTGTVEVEIWEADQYQVKTAKNDKITLTTTSASFEVQNGTLSNPDISPGRMVYIYTSITDVDLLSLHVYVGKYDG